MKNTIKLEEDETLQFEILNKEGNPTGEYLEFNLNDISLPLKYRDLVLKDKENKTNFRKDVMIVNKKQDVKIKGDPLSKNEVEIFELNKKYINKEVEIYNIFLGENGVQKLLNGRPLGWDTFDKIDKLIETNIVPLLNKYSASLEDMIKNKYSDNKEEELI